MQNFKNLLLRNKQLLPIGIVVVALLFAGGVAYAVSPQSPFVAGDTKQETRTTARVISPTEHITPMPQLTETPEKAVKGTSAKQAAVPTTTSPVAVGGNQQTQSTTIANTGGSATTATQPQTNTPPAETQPAQSKPEVQTVSVEIKAPDGTSSFSVEYHEGMNVCDVLQKGKDTGKIRSLTLDDSYMSSLKSRYVAEINGHANNWTFSVNGTSPLGCSLYQPKPNDTIIWKFS